MAINPTTGNLHVRYLQTPDIGAQKDLSQLVNIGAGVVELWASHSYHMPSQEIVVKISVGEGYAVRHKHQVCIFEERCLNRQQIELDRPLAKL
jgi:hypothetical protein